MDKFKGIITALATPFDGEGNINEDALEKLIEFNINSGVAGFFVCGSSAEVFYLTSEERRKIMQLTAKFARKRVVLIAHVCGISTAETVELAKYAEELGYDAVSSVVPFYHKLKFCEIKKYFTDVAECVNIPLFIYNIPLLTNLHFTTNELCDILENDKIIGIKHTSDDYFQLRQLKTQFPEKIIYNGFDETFLCGLVMGADGGIGSTYNIMPRQYRQLIDAYQSGDLKTAKAVQESVNAVIAVMLRHGVIPTVKYTLTLLGFDVGEAEKPGKVFSDEEKAAIRQELLAAGYKKMYPQAF